VAIIEVAGMGYQVITAMNGSTGWTRPKKFRSSSSLAAKISR